MNRFQFSLLAALCFLTCKKDQDVQLNVEQAPVQSSVNSFDGFFSNSELVQISGSTQTVSNNSDVVLYSSKKNDTKAPGDNSGTVQFNGVTVPFRPYNQSMGSYTLNNVNFDKSSQVWSLQGLNTHPTFTIDNSGPWPSVNLVALPDSVSGSKGSHFDLQVTGAQHGTVMISASGGMDQNIRLLHDGLNQIRFDSLFLMDIWFQNKAYIHIYLDHFNQFRVADKHYQFRKRSVISKTVGIKP